MTVLKIILVGLLAALFPGAVLAQCIGAGDLNGVWKSNDGGSYYIREVGSDVWWMGVSADGGATFTNVYKGSRDGDRISGQWADVRGKTSGHGALNLVVSSGRPFTRLHTTMMTGGFSGTTWYRTCNDNPAPGGNGGGSTQPASTMVRMPYLFGRSRSDASAILSGLGLKPLFSGAAMGSTVSEQAPGPGTSVALGSYVQLQMKPASAMVRMPYLFGRSRIDASAILSGLGLKPLFSGAAMGSTVSEQAPGPGTSVALGSYVQLQMKPASAMVRVPSLIGQRLSEAAAILKGLGLQARLFGNTSGFVNRQTPVAGTMVVVGTTILLSP